MDSIVQTELKISESVAKETVDGLTGLKIKSETDLKTAIDGLGKIKNALKNITEKKDSIIRPLNLSIKEVRDLFRAPETMLSEAEQHIKREMIAWQQKVAEKARKKEEKIEKKVEAGEMSLSNAMDKLSDVPRVEGKVEASNASVQFKTIRKVRIVDHLKIPARYYLNEAVQDALRKAVSKDALAGEVIPGVEVYEEQQVASGGLR